MPYQNIFLLLGSNLGERLENLNQCASLIEVQVGSIVVRSSIYETAPWGKADQNNFLNQAIKIESQLQPLELLKSCLILEERIGRVRGEKWGARTIDIDIIYFDNTIISSDDLKIPHPQIAERKFVLVPMNEIAPDFVHPISKKTSSQLLHECTDPLQVKLFSKAI